MTVEELYGFLEQRVPRSLLAEWDNDGLACLPDPARTVRRVLIALDATEAAVDRAVSGGFDVLLTHHPLLFRGVKALTPEANVPRKLLKLAAAGVAAMSLHTRLDAVAGGVNDVLAGLLGLADVVPFAPEGEVPCGRIGVLPAPVDARAFAAHAAAVLGTPAVLQIGTGTVQKIAVLGGEGGDFADAARAAGADLFLAGRIGYHRMLDAAENGLVAIEAGHYATEFPICHHLQELVRAADAAIEVEILPTAAIEAVAAKGENA